MKTIPDELALLVGKIEPRHIQLILILLTLSLLVLGAGAPIDGGGGIPGG
jgi:hypothetical protein